MVSGFDAFECLEDSEGFNSPALVEKDPGFTELNGNRIGMLFRCKQSSFVSSYGIVRFNIIIDNVFEFNDIKEIIFIILLHPFKFTDNIFQILLEEVIVFIVFHPPLKY